MSTVMFCERQPYPGAGYHCNLDAGHNGPHSDLTIMWDDASSRAEGTDVRHFATYRALPPENYVKDGFANPPDQVQVMGVVFPDGTVACQWQTEHRSHVIWPSFDDFMAVHGHPEYGTRIEWPDDDLLIQCDSLLSLIRHRESLGLTEQTVRDLDELLRPLRMRTDEIVAARRTGPLTVAD